MLKVVEHFSDMPITPTHQIHFYTPERVYEIACGHKNCFVRQNISEDDLQEIVELYNKQGDKFGYVEGSFAFDCEGIYFIHA